jgi:type IV pilus assembly protein PilY1
MRYANRILATALLGLAAGAAAQTFNPVNDDTDLFLNNPAVSSQRPNVLIFVDNTANWNTRFDNEKAALAQVFNSMSDQYNVGLMLYTETGGGNSGPDGSYVRAGMRQSTGATRTALANLVNSFDKLGDKGNNATVSLAMYEAYAYFAGIDARSGMGKIKRDYNGNSIGGLPASNAVYGLPGNAHASAATARYTSPTSDGCQKNILIFISNGPPNDNASSLSAAQTLLSGLTGQSPPATIALNPSGQQGNWADEYARYMANSDVNATLAGDQNVITYTVEIDPGTTGQGPATTALMKSMARNGRGKYFGVNGGSTAEIVTALQTILQEVQAVNTVFASTTLPVSVNVRGTNLNQVYIGMFRPDADNLPRWYGNLKMYKLAVDTATSQLYLADAGGAPAEDTVNGFITAGARSFWTVDSSFWAFRGDGAPSDAPDGPVVEKGGVAQQIRVANAASQAGRKLYTCTASSGGFCAAGAALSATPFSTANTELSAAALGAADAAEASAIVGWVRGADQYDENANTQTADIRASAHGDVLHSRPAVINYNRSGDDNDVYAFYGANDGVLRGVKGGTVAGGGSEVWGFVPREFFGRLKRLRDNAPSIGPASKKPYFADGPIGVYQKDANADGRLVAGAGDLVHLFVGMRRGGRFLYTLDVSDPENPKLLWRRDNTSPGYGELGQTWSEPRVIHIRGRSTPVLIMGAGYDPAVEDVNPCLTTSFSTSSVGTITGGTVAYGAGTCTVSGGTPATFNRSMGRGIMVIDAISGDLLWQAGASVAGAAHNLAVPEMAYSVSSDVAAVDTDGDGKEDIAWVGDNGGNVWRINLGDADPARWTVTLLAQLGGTGTSERRKFQQAPDVVYARDAGGDHWAVLIGSGDREHPFDATVTNRFYMLKDRGQVGGAPIGNGDLFNATAAIGVNSYGYLVTLAPGEKVISGAVTVAGATYFNTNQPSATAGVNACAANLGVARQYALGFQDAAPAGRFGNIAALGTRASIYPGGGYLPSPVPVVVQLNGKKYLGVVSGTSVQTPPKPALDTRTRTFWFIRKR